MTPTEPQPVIPVPPTPVANAPEVFAADGVLVTILRDADGTPTVEVAVDRGQVHTDGKKVVDKPLSAAEKREKKVERENRQKLEPFRDDVARKLGQRMPTAGTAQELSDTIIDIALETAQALAKADPGVKKAAAAGKRTRKRAAAAKRR